MSLPDTSGAAKFADLRVRLLSAAALLALGVLSVWTGGRFYELVVLVIAGAMTWELGGLVLAPDRPGLRAVIALATAASVAGGAEPLFHADPESFEWVWRPEYAVLALGPALFFIAAARDRALAVGWTALVVMASVELISARLISAPTVLWPMGIVIVSDAAGYFAGRLIGGPKFWPSLSPKKTWSGTVAGWVAAVGWTAVLAPYLPEESRIGLLISAPVFALAGQLADIGESWIKRRAGVKDVSNLIPGHGGVMDRFDAFTGAAALGMALEWLRAGLGG